MGMRHRNLIRNDRYLQNCIALLGNSDYALDHDKVLCEMVHLQTLADELSELLLPEENDMVNETEVRNAYIAFDLKMKIWREQNPTYCGSCKLLHVGSSLCPPYSIFRWGSRRRNIEAGSRKTR